MNKRVLYVGATLLAIGLLVVGAGWFFHEREIVLKDRYVAEWRGLAAMKQTQARGAIPYRWDSAVYISTKALSAALKQLEGARIALMSPENEDAQLLIRRVTVETNIGFAGIKAEVEASSPRRGLTLSLAAEGHLVFKSVRPVEDSSAVDPAAVAEFAISILSVGPRLKWGFLDIQGRRFLSELISIGLTRALENDLLVSIPFEDRIAINTDVNTSLIVPSDAGSVTLNVRLPGKTIEQWFSFGPPLILDKGIWLVAEANKMGQLSPELPPAPNRPSSQLRAETESLRREVASATSSANRAEDLLIWLRGPSVVDLVNQLKDLPLENRTVTFQSIATTGQLVSNGDSYAELANERAATAYLTINPHAQWSPKEGILLEFRAQADAKASIHAHARPIPIGRGFGTTIGTVGKAEKQIAGKMGLTKLPVGGHTVVIMNPDIPCTTVGLELRTDGKLVVGSMKTDVPSVGVRLSLPVPQPLMKPVILAHDVPYRLPINPSSGTESKLVITPAHQAIDFLISPKVAEATAEGYLLAADIQIQPVDHNEPNPAAEAAEASIRTAVDEFSKRTSCPTEQHIAVLIGDLEIGPNGEIWKVFNNAIHDLTKGPGPNNELVKAATNASNDLTKGPGPNNEVVKAVTNAANDLTKGPGPNNEGVKALRSIGIKVF